MQRLEAATGQPVLEQVSISPFVISAMRESMERIARNVREGRPPASVNEGLAELGAEAYRWTWGLVESKDPGSCLHLVPPEGTPEETVTLWRDAEELPFELAADTSGALIGRGCCVIRGFGHQPPEPLRLGVSNIRVLVIGASPRRRALEVEGAVRSLTDALGALPVELKVITGPGTLQQLSDLGEAQWDVVHLVAHGARKNETICFENLHGDEDYLPYGLLADELQARLRGVRLFTLAVCESTPLAVILASRFPGVRVVTLRTEMRQKTMHRFFAALHGALWALDEAGNEGFVERAFSRAVAELYRDREPEWFVPVLVGPTVLRPLVDFGLWLILDAIRQNAASGRIDLALDRARGLTLSPDEDVGAHAQQIVSELTRINTCDGRIDDLVGRIEQEANLPEPNWADLSRGWAEEQKSLTVAPTAGVRLAWDGGDAPPLDWIFFGDIFDQFRQQGEAALEALQQLALAQQGQLEALAAGCQRLAKLLEDRRKDEGVCSRIFAKGVCAEARRARSLVEEAARETVLADANRQLEEAALILLELGQAFEQAPADLLRTTDAAEARRERDSNVHLMREILAGMAPAPAPPAELLEAGRRCDLILWMQSPRAPVSARIPDTIEGVLEHIRTLGKRPATPALDLSRLGPSWLTALANEAAPLRLVSGSDQALHPYLVVGGPGVHADSRAEQWREVEVSVSGQPNSALRQLQIPALALLTSDQERLCLDVLLVPCVEAAEVTRRLHEIVKCRLSGSLPSEQICADLDPLDRCSVLAATGETSRAAAEALEQVKLGGTARSRAQLDRVRAAYLLSIHDARLALAMDSEPDLQALSSRLLDAVALLGLLLTDPTLGIWVRTRYAVYGSVRPEDTEPLLERVKAALLREFDVVLQRVEAGTPEAARVARQVRNELQAELRVAHGSTLLCAARSDDEPFQGGAQAARLLSYEDEVGKRLLAIHQRMRTMTHAEYLGGWVTAGRPTVDAFLDLVLGFGDLREALVSQDEALGLHRRLPLAADLEAGELADAGDLAGRSGGCRLYARLPADDALVVLSAHLALLVGKARIRQVRLALAKDHWNRREIVRAMNGAVSMDAYIRALDYRLVGDFPGAASELGTLCSAWVRRLVSQNQEREQPDDPDAQANRDWLKTLDEACKLADFLDATYPVVRHADLTRARSALHLACAVFAANSFEDGKTAWTHARLALALEPDSPVIVENVLLAAGMHAWKLLGTNDTEARRVLEDGLRIGGEYIDRHPEVAAKDRHGISKILAEVKGALESLQNRSVAVTSLRSLVKLGSTKS